MTQLGIHGLLVVDKSSGMSSRTVVDRARCWFPRGTRVGHTGTLDPLATGILVICVGIATRLAQFVQDMSKTYTAELRLGARSETDDLEGPITLADAVRIPDDETVRAVLRKFVGEIDQVPPSFSAAMVSGRRAYALARRGKSVTLQARKITIYSIDAISYSYPRLRFDVHCGKGTYIRALARDVGEHLGCGALIQALRRTRVGPFTADDAVSWDAEPSEARTRLLPLAAAVAELPQFAVDEQGERDLQHGRVIAYNGTEDFDNTGRDQVCAAMSPDGQLIAVGTWDAKQCLYAPEKVMADR